ncbi:MAG: PrpF domain-containing protein, partial [Burkholderiales bacterium]
FVPETCHKSHPVTGTVCISSACAIPGTIAARIAPLHAPLKPAPQGMVKIEHPSGMILIDLDADFSNGKEDLRRAALIRTARRIFEGHVMVPSKIWAGKSAAKQAVAA